MYNTTICLLSFLLDKTFTKASAMKNFITIFIKINRILIILLIGFRTKVFEVMLVVFAVVFFAAGIFIFAEGFYFHDSLYFVIVVSIKHSIHLIQFYFPHDPY